MLVFVDLCATNYYYFFTYECQVWVNCVCFIIRIYIYVFHPHYSASVVLYAINKNTECFVMKRDI